MKIKKTSAFIRENIFAVTAYCATLYYMEIISLMFTMALLFGKTPAVALGLIFSAVLSLHIILLNSGRNASRIMHLFLMDLHAALSVSSLASFWLLGSQVNAFNIVQITVRSVIFVIELPLIFALTDALIISRNKKENAA